MTPSRPFADWFSELCVLVELSNDAGVSQREAWAWWASGLTTHQAWLKYLEGGGIRKQQGDA